MDICNESHTLFFFHLGLFLQIYLKWTNETWQKSSMNLQICSGLHKLQLDIDFCMISLMNHLIVLGGEKHSTSLLEEFGL